MFLVFAVPIIQQAREVQQYDGSSNGCAKQKFNHIFKVKSEE